MGDGRRVDTARDQASTDPVKRADADHDLDDGFDTAHAHNQLAARTPRGATILDLPEHAFAGKGDQDDLWSQFEATLAARVVSDRPLALVRDMNGANRANAGKQLTELARVTTGGDLLVIAELTSVLPGAAVEAALACNPAPAPAQLRAYLMRVDDDLLNNELGDPALISLLRKTYPGSPIAIIPQLPRLLQSRTLETKELASWYVTTTPGEQVAMAMLRVAREVDAVVIAATFEKVGRGGWMWAFHVTDAMTAMATSIVQVFATTTPQPDVGAFLQRKLDRYAADGDAAVVSRMKAQAREVDKELAKARPDADAVVDELGVALGVASDVLEKPGNRRRFLAAATTSQIDQATQLGGLAAGERLDWLLDGDKVKLDELAGVLATWPDGELGSAIDDKRVARIRKRWPAARPAEVFGRVPDSFYGTSSDSAAVRRWIVDHGEPDEVLEMLTVLPGRTAARSTWLAGNGGWGWLDRIGGGVDDGQLRTLALHCPDQAVVARIQAQLLGDVRDADTAVVAPAPIASSAFENPKDRLDRKLGFERNRELADDAGELGPEDVAALQREPDRLGQALAHTRGSSLVRILYVLDPPLRQLLVRTGDAADLDVAPISGWVRTQTGDDVALALSDPKAAASAMRLWPSAPLEIFPQLRQPAVLARVLDANPDVLEWIIEHSEPMSALHAIAALAVVHATVAALEDNAALVDSLPSGQRLSPRERTYLYGLANTATGSLKQRLMERIEARQSDDDSDVDDRAAGDDRRKRDSSDFATALTALLDDSSDHVEDILALCREREAQAPGLVKNSPEVAARALTHTKQSPRVVFPSVELSGLLAHAALVEPTLDTVPGFLVLRDAAGQPELAGILAARIDAKVQPFLSWLRGLQAASGMSSVEQAGLAKVFAAIKTADGARELFKARFGSPVSTDYDPAEVGHLWRTLERLPRAHTEQLAVSGFHEIPVKGKPLDGEYAPGVRAVNLKDGLETRKDDNNPVYDRQDVPTTQMTRDEIKDVLRLDDTQLDQWVHDHRITRDHDVYTINPHPLPDRFTGVALHEVGHAVDAMLGSNTQLVFGLGGWRQYGDADFDAWATDLGGWDRVKSEDRDKIREAWTLWSNSSQAAGRPSRTISSLVEVNHPAISASYTGVGVVDFATTEDRGGSYAPFLRNGRAYMMNGVYQRRYSVPMHTVHSAPSAYSMTAPEEFFAECYMTYYLTFDGTPGSAAHKGELLPPWIKQWFDVNVDKVGHNPSKSSY